METWTSDVCGHEATSEAELIAHEEAHDVVVQRDGWRGQYLAPTLVLDVMGLLEDRDPILAAAWVPSDVAAAAQVWSGAMEPTGLPTPTDEEVELVQDWTTYHAGTVLQDQLGLRLHEEDGYVIFRCIDDAIAAHPAGKGSAS